MYYPIMVFNQSSLGHVVALIQCMHCICIPNICEWRDTVFMLYVLIIIALVMSKVIVQSSVNQGRF